VKRLLIAILAVAVFIAGLWIVVIPGETLINLLNDSLRSRDVKAEFRDFRKGLFYNFSASQIILSNKSNQPLLEVDGVSGSLSLLSLVKFSPSAGFSGTIGGGDMKGVVRLLKGKTNTNISITKANMREIPFFPLLGIDGRGVITGEIVMNNDKGDVRFTVEDADFSRATFGGSTLPLNVFERARGAMSINGPVINIVSFTMEGDGIYARVKGNVNRNSLDLTMELMPEKGFTEENPVFAMLENYRVSPGYYVIPVKSTLSF
jgi:type II secretion system protein N